MRLALVRALCATCIATAAGATPVDDPGHGAATALLSLRPQCPVSIGAPSFIAGEPGLGAMDAASVAPFRQGDRPEVVVPARAARSRKGSLLENARDLSRLVLATGLRDSLALLLAASFLALHLFAAVRAVARRRKLRTAGFLALTSVAGIVLFLARAGSPLDAIAFRAWTTPASASAQPPFPPVLRNAPAASDLLDPALGEASSTALVPVPEASPALLLALGLAALARRRRNRT
jgi:MYXO-CTERM domain-containing protein